MLTGFGIYLVSVGIGLVSTVRRMRLDHEPDDRPSDLVLLRRAVFGNPIFLVMIAVFPVVVLLADSAGVVSAVAASSALVVGAVVGTRGAVRNRGIEREHLLVATSIAFVVTALTTGVWSMFEVFADAPLISMRVPWSVGIVVVVGALFVQRRRSA